MKATLRLYASLETKTRITLEDGLFDKALNTEKEAMWFYDESLPDAFILPLKKEIKASHLYPLPVSEKAKSFEVIHKAIAFLDQKDLTKSSKIIALGGGAITDVVGFIASIYMRGLNLTFIPTTLLAMVDASIGGKTAINTHSKNRVGTFYPANEILIDTSLLEKMPSNLIEDGFSEIIKMAVTLDLNFTEALENRSLDIKEIIKRSIELKKEIVEKDLSDAYERKILNFGHTLGHALEKIHDYKLSHGNCVATGMLLEIEDSKIRKRVENLLNTYHCLKDIPFEKETLIKIINTDKKRSGDSITWIELNVIGKASLKEISMDELYLKIPAI